MQIKEQDYRVLYDHTTTTVIFDGVLRLRGTKEYAPIAKLLQDVATKSADTAPFPDGTSQGGTITLDLRQLRFLNSSGINILFKFVIQVRQLGKSHLVVYGSSQIPWQGKSLKNLQRLMPTLELNIA